MDDNTIIRVLAALGTTRPYIGLVTTPKARHQLWRLLNDLLLAQRPALYNERLGKKPLKDSEKVTVIQRTLALIGAFAAVIGTHQAVISTDEGWVRDISLQPRPRGMNWTAQHALSPQQLSQTVPRFDYSVDWDDFLFLCAKAVHIVAGYNAGKMPNTTATIDFAREHDASIGVRVIVKEHPLAGTVTTRNHIAALD